MLYEHELVAQGLARWHNGRLIPVMRGGDGRDEEYLEKYGATELFEMPDEDADFADLDDAQLAALKDKLSARVTEVVDGRRDPEIVGELTQVQAKNQVMRAVLAVERIEEVLKDRAETEGEYDNDMDGLKARVGGTRGETPEEGDGEGEGDGDGDGEGEGEAQTAAAPATPSTALTPARKPPLPAARGAHRPAAVVTQPETALRVTNHAAAIGSPYGALEVLNRQMLGEFLTDIIRRARVSVGQKTVLAHASYDYPKERTLEDGPDSHVINSRRVTEALAEAGLSYDALIASGPLCAPLPPIYDLPGIETAARPVRDALPSFMAARGGVQVGATPTMGTYEDAAGVITHEDNEDAGTLAVKNCMRIECPAFTPAIADSIYQCIEADNLAAMAYPELMARIAALVNAEQARLADSRLLQLIKDASTEVDYGDIDLGAWYYFLGAMYQGAAGIRSRNRTTANLALQALIPGWLVDLLALDSGRYASQDARPQTRAAIENALRGVGVVPYFYLDSPADGVGQIFGAQSSSTLNDFPEAAQIALYPAGTFLHLDAGELNLGVVRDSSLNSTNDFQVFQETWETVTKVGVESLWINLVVCPSGVAPSSATAPGCGT